MVDRQGQGNLKRAFRQHLAGFGLVLLVVLIVNQCTFGQCGAGVTTLAERMQHARWQTRNNHPITPKLDSLRNLRQVNNTVDTIHKLTLAGSTSPTKPPAPCNGPGCGRGPENMPTSMAPIVAQVQSEQPEAWLTSQLILETPTLAGVTHPTLGGKPHTSSFLQLRPPNFLA